MSDFAFEPGMEIVPYATDPLHRFLHEDFWRFDGGNIGARGENLTITFLSLNRAELSIRLCQSIAKHIPDFAGEALIVDNGSDAREIERLRQFLATMPFRWRLHSLGRNYGVAGGRNRGMALVETAWVMSLDNDFYLIANPLPRLQADIARLGCHFLCLSFLGDDATTTQIRGGHMYVSAFDGKLSIGGGSAQKPGPAGAGGPGYLCTFMAGGAALFRKNTFLSLGGYDENMFVGFEDTEFSLRIFRAGLKIGASDTPAFVHAHPAPSTDADLDAERQRFSTQRLKASAEYFEAKHGYAVWNQHVADWLAYRERELGLAPAAEDARQAEEKAPEATKAPAPPRRRIGLVVDRLDWALGHIASQVQKHLSDEFDIAIVSQSEVENPVLIYYMLRDHDLVHFFWRGTLKQMFLPWREADRDFYFGSTDALRSRTRQARNITFSVYDHLFLAPEQLAEYDEIFTAHAAAYTVSSQKLQRIYSALPNYPDPAGVIADGVDLGRFRPRGLGRLREVGDRLGETGRALRIGWVGNSEWAQDLTKDSKGVNTILKPAIAQLRAEGVRIEAVFADRKERLIPHHRMPDYYNAIDVLVCVSEIEGTPNPVLEAMACGVPVISTDVGIVPDALGPMQKRFILANRSVADLKRAIRDLLAGDGLLSALSQENLAQIRDWDWSIRCEDFRTFFRRQTAMRAHP